MPQAQRPRTIVFIQFPDHHHGEVARGRKDVGTDATYNWSKVALKLTMEHPSETLLYMYNSDLTATNQMSSSRWNALGSPEFERMAFDQLRDFGVSVYGVEDGPKNGNYAPSFHIINHVVYHTSLDTPDLVPAEGMSRSIRAFASIIDHVNKMTMAQLRGPNSRPKMDAARFSERSASSARKTKFIALSVRRRLDISKVPEFPNRESVTVT
jgi:hypothetical protein